MSNKRKRKEDMDDFIKFVRACEYNESNEDKPVEKKIKYEREIKNIQDLINIIDSGNNYSNINMESLKKIKQELKDLNGLIGLDELKTSILQQLLYYLQGLHKFSDDYLHTILSGSPGTGKTTVAKILGNLFSKLGILSNNKFMIARRDNLVGGYLGQTAIKTQKLLDECKGGVMFIDEVYSLGNSEGRDSYAKEAIDTINLFLSENKHNFMMIVAGYEEEIEKCFFSFNPGLKRRFMWHHKIKDYNAENITEMFIQMIHKQRWKIDDNFTRDNMVEFFKKHFSKFSNFGGDIEKFLTQVKINHSTRVFSLNYQEKKVITKIDLDKSINKMEIKKKNEPPPMMYL